MIRTLKQKIREQPVFFCFFFIFILYLLPTLIQLEFDKEMHIKDFYIGLPGVSSGDEPHYFVITTSIINDHDIYLYNNYNDAYFYGGCDVGFHFINNTRPWINRHISFFDSNSKIAIPRYEYNLHNESLINVSKEQINYVREIYLYKYNKTLDYPNKNYNITKFKAISHHPNGLPVFSSIFLWPFKEKCFMEHAAIYLTVLVSFIGVVFFYLICLHYVKKHQQRKKGIKHNIQKKKIQYTALFFTIIFALGTQYWHYSKTYLTEPYMAAFLLCAYYLFFIKKMNFLPGLMLAVGFSMKYPFGMYLALFGLVILYNKEWKRIFYFTAGSLAPITAVFYSNWVLTGNIFGFKQTAVLVFGNYIHGIFVWLFDPIFGLLPFAPFFIFSLLGFWILYKQDKKTLLHFGLMTLPYFFFHISLIDTQVGPVGYSARYLIPILGFLVLLCMFWYQDNKNKVLKWLFFILVGISFIINAQAAFMYFLLMDNPSWILIIKVATKWDRIIDMIGLV